MGPKRRVIRLKKKNNLSQILREFFKPTRHAVFYFLFFFFTSIGLCLHAHPKPKMTEKFQLPYFQKSNGILHVFWALTGLNSSKTANFLCFRSKNEKKNNFKKKKWKSEFCKIKCAQKNKCGRKLWDTEFFFFFSQTKWEPYFVMYFQITLVSQRHSSVLVNKHCAFYVNELSIGPCMCYIQDASVWWQASPLTK